MTKKTFGFGLLCFAATFIVSAIVNLVVEFPEQIGEPVGIRAVQITEFTSSAASVNVEGVVLDLNSRPKTATLRLKNNGESPIVAYTFESGNFMDSDGTSRIDGSNGASAIAWPNDEFIVPINFNNFSTGMPIRLSAVVFADGSAEGEIDAKAELLSLVEGNTKAKSSRELFHF